MRDAASSDGPLRSIETSPLQIPFESDSEHAYQSQNFEDEDQGENSPLAYARARGLTQNILDQDPRHSILRLPKSTASGPDLEDPPDVYQLPTEFHVTERLVLDRHAAVVLGSALCTPEPVIDFEDPPKSRQSAKALRLELPLLSTDNELDVRRFQQRRRPDLQMHSGIVPLPVHIGNDEGFGWPSEYKDLPRQLQNSTEKEKLEFPRDALRFLKDVLTDSSPARDEQPLIGCAIQWSNCERFQPVTPPLLPPSSPVTPFVPLLDAAPIECLSEGSSLVTKEIQRIATELEKQDTMGLLIESGSDPMLLDNTDDMLQLYSPLQSIVQSRSSTPVKRKFNTIKIEVPLTPQGTAIPTKRSKSVLFSTKLHESILALPPRSQDEEQRSEDSLEAFYQHVIEPTAIEAERMLSNEHLTAADATMRVNVPIVEQIHPVPPWLEYASKSNNHQLRGDTKPRSQKTLLNNIHNKIPIEYHRLQGVSKIENQLKWSPFQLELSKVALGESIQDDRLMANIALDMSSENVVIAEMLVWKREGLRVLDELAEDEDELEPTEIGLDEDMDLSALIRVRAQDLDVPMTHTQPQHNANVGFERHTRGARTISDGNSNRRAGQGFHAPPIELTQRIGIALKVNSLFSASNSLSAFMEGRGANPAIVPRAISSTSALEQKRASPSQLVAPDPATPIRAARSKPEPSHGPLKPLSIPALPSILPQTTVIVSSSILAHQRRLIKELDVVYPGLEMIERDFATLPQPPCHEADIILSPSTGMILTTLQKIKQRPLPGQESSFYGIRERLRDVCIRYSRLIVLIADSSSPSTCGNPDDRDCIALAELIGFSSSLDSEAQILYVAGADTGLANWIAHCISTHHFEMQSLQKSADAEPPALLADETTWERFLRRVGLNAFAVQAVLAELREPMTRYTTGEGSAGSDQMLNSSSQSASGDVLLRAFIAMTPHDRIRRFETLLGGRGVVERMNRALEQRWLSAADDFSALDAPHFCDGTRA